MIDAGRLASIVERFSASTVLVVGDLMLDEYVWGDVRRVSPEAPVPVVEVERTTYVPGGSANAAATIVALGGDALLAGVVGDDEGAAKLAGALEERGIGTTGLVRDSTRPTTTKTRIMANVQQVARTDRESRAPLPDPVETAVLDRVREFLPRAGAVVLSDYAKGVVSPTVAQEVITMARGAGVPVVVDPKGREYGRYRGATVVTPNLEEAEDATGLTIRGDADLPRIAAALADSLGDAALLVTRGPSGMALFDNHGADRPLQIPAAARQVFDVTGAGDTVVATLALALANDVHLAEAAEVASIAAGAVVGKVGTSVVTAAELLDRR